MGYNARNRKAAEEEFEGIGYSIEDELSEDFEEDDDIGDYIRVSTEHQETAGDHGRLSG